MSCASVCPGDTIEYVCSSTTAGPRVDELEALAGAQADQAGVTPAQWDEFLVVLRPLALHNSEMYAHSLRVGIYAAQLASLEGLDDGLALYGGCGHDIGKIFVSNDILRSSDFGPKERAAMEDHPRAGQELLAPFHLFTSFIAGMHHTFQENPYGMDLDDMAPFLHEGVKGSVVRVARLVAECDFYDALTTRPARAGEDTSSTASLSALLSDRVSAPRIEWLLANDLVFVHG